MSGKIVDHPVADQDRGAEVSLVSALNPDEILDNSLAFDNALENGAYSVSNFNVEFEEVAE